MDHKSITESTYAVNISGYVYVFIYCLQILQSKSNLGYLENCVFACDKTPTLIIGLVIPCLYLLYWQNSEFLICSVCQNMNHHTSSRQRRRDSNNDKMKKLQNGRSCSIHSSMLGCLQSNNRGNLINSTGTELVTR